MPFALSVIIGLFAGGVLALIQHLLTTRLISHILGEGKGIKLAIALKMPLSIVVLVPIALISLEALAFAAAGFTIATVMILAKRRKVSEANQTRFRPSHLDHSSDPQGE